MSRPSAAVIVPFAGTAAELDRVLAALLSLERGEQDELIVVLNGGSAVPPASGPAMPRASSAVRVLEARAVPTPAHARNAGAAAATAEWLVFIDADTLPVPGLLDAYLVPPPGEDTAILAGAIRDVAVRDTWVARRAVARQQMDQRVTLARGYAQTANCAIRRSAFLAVGGFEDGLRAGEDADLCLRLVAAGWQLDERSAASVEHRARETLRGLLAQLAVHGAGAAEVERRHPGSFPAASPRQLGARLVRDLARGDVLELLGALAFEVGRLRVTRGDEPRRRRSAR